MGERNGGVDNGMRRSAEEEELRQAEPQQRTGGGRRLPHRPAQERAEDGIDLTQPAQRGRRQEPRKRQIGGAQPRPRCGLGYRIIERLVAL